MSRLATLTILALTLAACKDDGPPVSETALPPTDSGSAVDNDGDGVPADEDCDDDDASVNPSAQELCDGLDNNCDGQADEGVLLSWYADGDGDGYGAGEPIEACAAPEGHVAVAEDCDDARADINPAAAETDCADPTDYNCDGSTGFADNDGDGFPACEDCDDADGAVNPDGVEVCDGLDNNCDGLTDGADALDAATYYQDRDGDTFGDADFMELACAAPEGYAAQAGDCDDGAAAVNPSATEVCNTIDDDCDAAIDEDDAADAGAWYADSDGDCFGDADVAQLACEAPEGTVADASDCDDGETAVNPDAAEVCDGQDNNCDGAIDEASAADAATWYSDADEDGFGDASAPLVACDQPAGAVADSQDCDDGLAAVNPDATELCDGQDNDCDGDTDEPDAADAATWYSDDDGDGYGDGGAPVLGCDAPTGTVADATDCDDSDVSVNPGEAEVYYDGVDADCDEASDYDADGDGDDAELYGGGDCDDGDAGAYTGLNCRPDPGCVSVSLTTLASKDPSGGSDLVFDDSCAAYVSSLISGTDYVYKIAADGTATVITGYSNYNIPAMTLSPAGKVVVSHNDNSTNAVGQQGSGTTISNLVTGTFSSGSSWANSYMNYCSSSIAVDDANCAWTPNFSGKGTLVCANLSTGAKSTLLTLSDRIEGVYVGPDGGLYASAGKVLYTVDTSAATSVALYTASATILDLVVDYNGDVYLETTGNEILRYDASSATASVYDTVSGDGKLAISPDGRLVRLILNPPSAATYEEWTLGD